MRSFFTIFIASFLFLPRVLLSSRRPKTHKTCTALLPSGLRPIGHQGRRETETSSGASDEAPERALKDATEGGKLHYEGSVLFVRLSVEFLRLPSDASHVRRIVPAREIYVPPRPGNSFPFPRQQRHYSKNPGRTAKTGPAVATDRQRARCPFHPSQRARCPFLLWRRRARRPARALSAGFPPNGNLIYGPEAEI